MPKIATSPPYPDLLACGLSLLQLRIHATDGLETLDEFWEDHGINCSRERLAFAEYTAGDRKHTLYVTWERSHASCAEVDVGIEARPREELWPGRSLREHRLKRGVFKDFVDLLRNNYSSMGVRARFAYPRDKGIADSSNPPGTRLNSVSFDVLDDKKRPEMRLTWRRKGAGWVAIVDPLARVPFPEGSDFLAPAYQMACGLSKSLRQG